MVRRLMRRMGVSIRTLAHRAGLPERTTRRIAHAEQKVSLDQADDIADGLDVPLPEMVAASKGTATDDPDGPTPDLRPGPLSLHVADAIRDRMQLLGVNEGEIADRSGLPAPALTEILAGRRAIYLDELHVIARALDLDPIAMLSAASGADGGRATAD